MDADADVTADDAADARADVAGDGATDAAGLVDGLKRARDGDDEDMDDDVDDDDMDDDIDDEDEGMGEGDGEERGGARGASGAGAARAGGEDADDQLLLARHTKVRVWTRVRAATTTATTMRVYIYMCVMRRVLCVSFAWGRRSRASRGCRVARDVAVEVSRRGSIARDDFQGCRVF